MKKKANSEALVSGVFADYQKTHIEEKNTNKIQSHPYSEIIVISKGDVIYASKGKVTRLGDRSVIYNRAGTIHNNFVQKQHLYERYKIKFYEEELLNTESASNDVRRMFSSSFTKELTEESFILIYELAKSIHSDCGKQQLSPTEELRISKSLLLIMMNAFSAADRDKLENESYILDVIEYINEHLSDKLTIPKLADNFFVSKGKLIYDFKAYCNMSINEYITMERVERSKELLLGGFSVADIAENCGFSSPSYFIKVFSTVEGITPLKYKIIRSNRQKK